MHFIFKKTFSGLCMGLMLIPTLYLAFFYEGLHKTAYAQTSGFTNAPNPSANSSFGATAGGSGPSATFGGGAALEGATGAAKCGVHILVAGAWNAIAAAIAPTGLPVKDIVTNTTQGSFLFKDGFLDCLARAIAKAILRAITRSIVAWAQSGFNGNPSFVEDFKGFMVGIADETIGEYILGTPLAFLCSPFNLRVRIALAKRFARQKAPLCTLSGIIKNIEGFTSDFSQGGWPAFLEFTVAANNNPFGGYITAEAEISSRVAGAQGQKALDLQLGSGFLSFEEKTNCKLVGTGDADPTTGAEIQEERCDKKVVTPGRVIEGSLSKALGTNFEQLEAAKYFDEIIDALITGLMVKVLYGGLSNFRSDSSSSRNSNLIFDDNFDTGPSEETRNLAAELATQVSGAAQLEARVRNHKLDSLSEIEGAERKLASLALCWEKKSHPDASNNAANARLTILALKPRKEPLEKDVITREARIEALDILRQKTRDARSLMEVHAFTQEYLSLQSASTTATLLTLSEAEIEATKTRDDMKLLNESTQQSLNQCNASN